MPLFTYICDNGHRHDALATNGRHPVDCPECGHPACRLFKTVQVATMEPYFTRAGDGQLREIRSSNQERALEAADDIYMTED